MVCLGLLWNGMQDHLKEALTDIATYGEILDCFSINFGDSYENFVRDIYAQDEIAEWKVNKKLETMFACSDSRTITVFMVNIDTKEQEYHPYKKRMVYINLERMKREIREKYSHIVPVYFFDNTMHVTDDEKEFKADFGVVKSYIEKGFKPEPVQFKEEEKPMILSKRIKEDGTEG